MDGSLSRVSHRLSAILLAGLLLSACYSPSPYQTQTPAHRWFKGNTHTHTNRSDGLDAPDVVTGWYKSHGYDFLVLTDHNTITDVQQPGLLLIPGEEVSSNTDGRSVHVNGLGLTAVAAPLEGTPPSAVLQATIDAVRDAGGIPQVNHPFFQQGLTAADLDAATRYRLFELHNGHPAVPNGLEPAWDQILSTGHMIYGVATDDAHQFATATPAVSGPGRGWVMVWAASLDQRSILAALERGDFYASTGAVIERITVEPCALTIVAPLESRVAFIGSGGTVFGDMASPARYVFNGEEQYIRAKVTDGSGAMAWTQPVPVRGCS